MSYPTLHEIRTAADDYWQVWEQLLSAAPKLRQVIGQHSPSAIGWKVEGDISPLEAAERVYELGDSLFVTPVNRERSILTLRKPTAIALDTLQHIKFLQRRPSRPDDALGPDSLDFLAPHGLPKAADIMTITKDLDAVCKEERNEAHNWISIRYQGHEFKLAEQHVWDICVREAAAMTDLTIS